ncbi:MAG: hypothetical protein Q8N96_07655 [Methylovulum sp.]|nr:hypothetical protein [Methylovulum sp.]
MIVFNPDDTTKPSRLNRTRKRRWRPSFKSGLTDCYQLAIKSDSKNDTQ